MTLRLVSSGDDRALAIRDHLVPLVRLSGSQEVQRDSVRLISLQRGSWIITHWTPFNELARDEASSPGYRHALGRQQSAPSLPYGMDVSHDGRKVLSRAAKAPKPQRHRNIVTTPSVAAATHEEA